MQRGGVRMHRRDELRRGQSVLPPYGDHVRVLRVRDQRELRERRDVRHEHGSLFVMFDRTERGLQSTSMLLWVVRPTLTGVATVGALASGWTRGRRVTRALLAGTFATSAVTTTALASVLSV